MYKFDNITKFNEDYYNYLIKTNDIFENKSLNLIHHIWRVVLQFEITDRIKQVCDLIIGMQKPNGEWGERDKHHNFGDTVVNLHRLLWSLFIIQKEKDNDIYINKIIEAVKESVDYIIENHDMHYNINRTFGHGMIDRLHYLMQTEYYLLDFDVKYCFLNQSQRQKLAEFWKKDTNWMIDRQMQDGGWHEVDRVRSRIGTTSDAIRGINLNDECLDSVKNGIKFIINNQNIYDGYWEAGNIDKNTDALKALINSRRIMDDAKFIKEIDKSIINGTKWLVNNFDKAEKLEENDYDLLTVTIDYEKVIVNNMNVDFV